MRAVALLMVLLIRMSIGAAAADEFAPDPEARLAPSQEQVQAEKVVDRYGPALMKIPGVNADGVGADEKRNIIISVHVDALTPTVESAVPRTLGGFRVEVRQLNPLELEGWVKKIDAK